MNRLKKTAAVAACVAALAAGAAAQTVQINGAGATFPYPIYSKWFAEYNKLHANVQLNYQSIGSGGGIRQITNETVFFGATDGPMTDDEMGKAKGGRIQHVPMVIGALAIIYNVPGIKQPLNPDNRNILAWYERMKARPSASA